VGADIQPYDPGLPDLHPDPAQWSHEDFVAAWQENDDRSAWNRAVLAAAYQGAHGDLKRYADAVGASYQTLKNYRAVVKAYADLGGIPRSTDVGTFPFGVADALRGQKDRLALVRREQPWSVEEARLLVQSRRPRPRTVVRGTAEPVTPKVPTSVPLPAEPEPGPPGPVQEQVTAAKPPAGPAAVPDTQPQPCPRCAPQIAELEQELADRLKDLEKAHGQIQRLRDAHPDTVMAAELESVTADRDRLAARVLELEVARLAQAAGRGPEPAPPVAADPEPEAADSAHGDEQDPAEPGARGQCGALDAGRVVIVVDGTRQRVMSPDGGEELEWLCTEHRALLAGRTGAQVIPAPGELLSWDAGACQWPAAVEVTA
jgi:hypothetical protein